MKLDFMQESTGSAGVSIFDGAGHDGAELKDMLPRDNPNRVFVIPFGGNESDYNADDSLKIKDVIPGYTIIKYWMNVDDLNPAAKEVIKPRGKMFSRLFLGANGPTGNEWWRDLGFNYSFADEKKVIDSGMLSAETWKSVYPNGKFFNGSSVLPQVWHNFPLVEVIFSGKGKDKTVSLGEVVWAKMKLNQVESMLAAFMGLDDPILQWRYVIMNNSWTGTDRYSFSRADGVLPEELRETCLKGVDAVNDRVTQLFKTIFEVQHGGVAPTTDNLAQDKKSNENVKKFLLGITNFDSWDEYVEHYRILAEPLSDLVTVNEFTLSADE